MTSAFPIVHFAYRATEPTGTACGGYARHIYVGGDDQDEISRRQRGQSVTTCVSCRRAMLWGAKVLDRAIKRRD